MQDEKGRKRPTVRRQGKFGEPTVLKRVPLSVVPLLDCLLDKMERLAKNDPRKTMERFAEAVQLLADKAQKQDDDDADRAQSLRN